MSVKPILAGLLLGAVLLAACVARASEAPAPDFAREGALTCMKCHDAGRVLDILSTPHALKGDDRTPFGQHGCESCHGASPQHINSHPAPGEKRALPTIRFSGPNISSVGERNAACLACHENGARIDWRASTHDRNGLACSSCHTIHVRKDPILLKATQPDKCFTCHAEQRAESFQYSHHPIREGKVVCADCHNPHGSPGPKLLWEFTVNETCYNCHAEKRGPLLWEHQPVRENCDICHTPHGSPEARLLIERMPFLCSSCHSSADNTSGGFFGGAQALPGGAPLRLGMSDPHLQYRSCLNCHTQVHGSNSPSGAAFFR